MIDFLITLAFLAAFTGLFRLLLLVAEAQLGRGAHIGSPSSPHPGQDTFAEEHPGRHRVGL